MQANFQPGSSVLVIGGGFIGQLKLQMAEMYGANPVVVSETDETKQSLLYVLGADKVLNPLNDGLMSGWTNQADSI